jgi:hypothetical protein
MSLPEHLRFSQRIDSLVCVRHSVGAEIADRSRARFLAQLPPQLRITRQPHQTFCQHCFIAGRPKQTMDPISDDFRYSADAAGDHGSPGVHRLEKSDR